MAEVLSPIFVNVRMSFVDFDGQEVLAKTLSLAITEC